MAASGAKCGRTRCRRLSPSFYAVVGAVGIVGTVGLGCAAPFTASASARAPDELNDGWTVAAPASVGVDPEMLAGLSEALGRTRKHGIDSVVIVRRGQLIYEAYARADGRDTPHDLRSATKSITALLVGIVVDRGLLAVDQKANQHLSGAHALAKGAGVTVEHLLTMRAGLACDDRDRSSPGHEDRMYRRRDWVAYFAGLKSVFEPGTHSAYCTGGVVALGEVLRAATGQGADDFAREALFEPLGIENARWARFDRELGIDTGGHLELRTRDFAKMGELVRTGGRWRGRQVVSTEWINAATSIQTRVDEVDYGYLWWLAELPTNSGGGRVWYASGNGGQTLLVAPSLELVVAFTGRNYNSPKAALPFQIFAQAIVPGISPLPVVGDR